MKQLPCITKKCLKYPVCRNKVTIICDLLNDYCLDLDNEVVSYDLIWEILEKDFPVLITVGAETFKSSDSYPSYINRYTIPREIIKYLSEKT